MAVNDSRLRVTELDFDDIKTNLKTYLKAQTQFKDYDFEGSGMNILLDTLSYNTHYLAYNANMVANEMFLDSSSLRSSVASHAKSLGYQITSARAPVATINISLSTTDPTKTMPAGTAFNSTIDNQTFQFVTIASISGSNTGSSVAFNDVKIYEGTYTTSKYIVNTSNVNQRFILTDPRADTSTLTVKVQTSVSDTSTLTYTMATDITQLTTNSKVYFLQEVEAGRFEVYFGDGVISQALSDGNIVDLRYVITNKTQGNGSFAFSSPSAIDGATNITLTTVGAASGGAEPESMSSIKLKAPLDYAAQGRAVSTKDYEVYVKKLFANTQAVSVWGGEDGSYDTSTGVSSTPEYGKVFISIKSTTGQSLTTVQKTNLVTALSPYKVSSITPVIVDAETTFLILGVTFQYDSSITTLNITDISTKISSTLENYNNNNLQSFNNTFRHSALLGLIDNSDNSIMNNTTVVTMAQYYTPTLGTTASKIFNFANPFYSPHSGHNAAGGGIVASTGFYLGDGTTEYFLDDDGVGNLRIYSLSGLTRIYFNSFAGTVDYGNGKITLGSVNITGISNVDGTLSTRIRVTVIPSSYDIVPVRNQILEIDLVNTNVSGSIDAAATTGLGYITTQTGSSSTTTVSTTSSSASSSSGSSSSSSSTGSSSSSTPSSSAY